MNILDMFLKSCLKCEGQNNNDKGYLAQMGDAKKDPY